MKASEFIKELQEMIAEYGDLEITSEDDDEKSPKLAFSSADDSEDDDAVDVFLLGF